MNMVNSIGGMLSALFDNRHSVGLGICGIVALILGHELIEGRYSLSGKSITIQPADDYIETINTEYDSENDDTI